LVPRDTADPSDANGDGGYTWRDGGRSGWN
jgi:hypothetical protein